MSKIKKFCRTWGLPYYLVISGIAQISAACHSGRIVIGMFGVGILLFAFIVSRDILRSRRPPELPRQVTH